MLIFLVLLLLLSAFARAQSSDERLIDFAVRESNLAEALAQFARQAAVQTLFPYELASATRANPVVGRFTIRAALDRLLQGSDFTGEITGRGIITITQAGMPLEQPGEHLSMRGRSKQGFMAGLAALFLGSGGATAQDPRGGAPGALEEIVVTAQKREARLQDVPMTLSALSGTNIERINATDFRDVLRYIPGVSYSGEEHGQSKYNIRGVSTTSTSPTVGVFLDDVSLLSVATNFSGSADPVFFDFERLEVLKGPQGTLYGGNAMGGAIKYVSRRPTLDESSLLVGAGVAGMSGGDLGYESQAVFNAPVVDNVLAVRGGVLYRQRGGFIDQVANAPIEDWRYSQTSPPAAFVPSSRESLSSRNESNHNTSEVKVGRLSALWTPDETLSVLPSIFVQRYEQDNSNSFLPNLPGLRTTNRFEEPGEDSLDVASLTITKDFGAVEFTSLSGYMDRDVGWYRDYSFFVGSLVPPIFGLDTFNVSESGTRNLTQEFRLASTQVDSRWHWVVGTFYSDQKDRLFQEVETGGAGAAFGTGTDIVYVGDTRTKTVEYALFGELTYSITDALDATLGLRYFSIDQKVDAEYDGIFNGGFSEVVGQKKKETGLNPKLSLVYRATDENMLYATASRGFRQGGPNRFAFDPDLCRADLDRLGITERPEDFASDKIWTYELGSKNRFGNGRVTANASAYFTDWKNIQQTIELTGCGFNFTGNVGSAEVKGAEIDLQLGLTEQLSLTVAAAYTDAKITDSSPGVSAQAGQRVLDVPKWMAVVGIAYTVELASGWSATMQADHQYQGSNSRSFNDFHSTFLPDGTLFDLPNAAQIQASHQVSNAFLLFESSRWEYRFYARNIFDKRPILDFSLNDAINATTIRPRTYGLDVRMHF